MGVFDFIKRLTGSAIAPTSTKPATDELPTLPLHSAELTANEPPKFIERRQGQRLNPQPGTKVLIIDDSATVVAALRKMLTQAHLEVHSAEDGSIGLETAFRHRPQLIFLDIVMPGINGFNVLRTLRRDERTRSTPVIMMSGNEQATEEFYVQRIGADGFLKKPFSRAEVFVRIEYLLDKGLMPRRSQASTTDSTSIFVDSSIPRVV